MREEKIEMSGRIFTKILQGLASYTNAFTLYWSLVGEPLEALKEGGDRGEPLFFTQISLLETSLWLLYGLWIGGAGSKAEKAVRRL